MKQEQSKSKYGSLIKIAVIGVVLALLTVLLWPAHVTRELPEELVAKDTFRQLACVIVIYRSEKGHYPSPYETPEGGKLSWRVAILPLIGEKELYNEFHHHEPWNSEHNSTLTSRMPSLFQNPSIDLPPGKTNFLAVTGPGTFFEKRNKPIEFVDTKDGMEKTVMLVEADPEAAVIWTQPVDWEYDPKRPLHNLGGFRSTMTRNYFLVIAGSTEVRAIPADIPEEDWKALLTRDGGEDVAWPDFDPSKSSWWPW